MLDGFLRAVGADATSLVVHDLGGPVGLYWACHNPERVQKLALLNTLVYPEPSWAVVAFVAACRTPGVRALLVSLPTPQDVLCALDEAEAVLAAARPIASDGHELDDAMDRVQLAMARLDGAIHARFVAQAWGRSGKMS